MSFAPLSAASLIALMVLSTDFWRSNQPGSSCVTATLTLDGILVVAARLNELDDEGLNCGGRGTPIA
jgi:hypothetical protein